ncbi:MAG TPA: DUF1549 domain-containing protein, partial [Bryobacteraceae bacterium]|nr:DUF1549 domain-containing protein [Bryobacteraceae bacterium]
PLFLAISLTAASRTPVKLVVEPGNPLLFGKDSRQQLVVVLRYSDGTEEDVTSKTRFSSARPSVAEVDTAGIVTAKGNGGAEIRASYAGRQAVTTALVQRAENPTPPSFSGDILPVLTKAGCNGGSCHGALNGQNGFKLSLFGYDPSADYEMIVHKHDGRRLNLADAEKSLLLRKPTFDVPHGGGKRLKKGSTDYSALLDWIRSGAKLVPANERRVVSLRVAPDNTVLFGKGSARQLLVTARYSDGTERDVTRIVAFQSNDDSIAKVSPEGLVTADRGGETAITVRAPGVASAAKVGVVTESRAVPAIVSDNFIDRFVFEKLQKLEIPPSEPADDATFLRRASLDIIGVIPRSEEARRFLASRDPDKRAKLVEELLHRPEYADFWALYWGDHLNNTKQLLYNKGPYTFTRWLHDQFQKNAPYDQFVRELLTSSGNMYDAPATSFYPLMKKEQDLAAITSQLFLGVSIECARCHNHPLEKWSQNDFNSMAAFFSQVRYKSAGPRNNERILYVDYKRQFQNPDTKQIFLPKPLDGPVMSSGEMVDRRELLADWITSPQNPFFAKALVNRMWRNFMGRGLVEPVDDFRVTNPPTNPGLLDALAKDFIDHRYDLHHLIRQITSSRAYQLSSRPSEGNRDDKMAYSRHYSRRMIAEQMLDSIALATGVPEQFRSLYPGTRAAELPEPEVESYFLEVFDRPSRQIVCERKQQPNLNQAMHLISGETIQKKATSPQGVLAKMLRDGRPAAEIVEELYLRTVSRYPDASEKQWAAQTIAKENETQGLQDVFWALLNSKEFLYNH